VVPPINILNLKMKIPEPDEFRITAMITEDIGKYRNTMRILMIEDSLWLGEEIIKSVQCPGLNLANCKILILLENSDHQVVGCYHQPLIVSGIEEVKTEFKVYPNPSTGQVNVESTEPIGILQVYSLTGKVVFAERVESTMLRLNLKPGMYVLKLQDETRKIVVR
jgi:hypothetical protein